MSMDTLRSRMRSLRHKLKNIHIENISGAGYKLHIEIFIFSFYTLVSIIKVYDEKL